MAKTAAAVQQYWADQLELMQTLPAEVRTRQPESIHDLRAAGRRLKATARLYRPLIRPKLASDLIEQLDWYNSQLGQARDAEVIAEEVADLLDNRPGARAVIAALEAEARRTAHLADRMLGSEAAAEVLRVVAELVDDPWPAPGGAPTDDQVLGRVRWAEKRVAREWRAGPTGGEGPLEWAHRLRRRAKAARYAAESVEDAIPESKKKAAGYARVATLLGIVQDTVVIQRALMVWPTALVTEPVAARERLAEEASSEVPQAVREALPADLRGKGLSRGEAEFESRSFDGLVEHDQ